MGVETCGKFIDRTDGEAMYQWRFPELRQLRKHFQDGALCVVKARSIRRIVVLDAPADPVDQPPLLAPAQPRD